MALFVKGEIVVMVSTDILADDIETLSKRWGSSVIRWDGALATLQWRPPLLAANRGQ